MKQAGSRNDGTGELMNSSLSVAVPWSLTNYIPLNGFHPLYRALFESKPDWVQLFAWDNIELSERLRGDLPFRREILREVQRDTAEIKQDHTNIEREYLSSFWAPNRSLTRLLPGDIEFHHTAPFPSLQRPFVFHCESFAPVFYPFAHSGTGELLAREELRRHYKPIFEHPLCLGISSHLSQTLEDISHFFSSSVVDKRLFASGIGTYVNAMTSPQEKGPLEAPVLLFINSAHQNPANFSRRGGHLVLRYWQSAYPEPGAGRLIMRCTRPPDSILAEQGVDLDWLRKHERLSVIWIEDYLSAAELEALMRAAHVFLLPSASLHSASIMQAMAAGAVPVVSDTLGTDRFVQDSVDGIVLRGVYAANWTRDPDTGVRLDRYQYNAVLEADLVRQMAAQIGNLLADKDRYRRMQAAAVSKANRAFSGKVFSEEFWQQVGQRYRAMPADLRALGRSLPRWPELTHCLLKESDWSRIFTSPPQPVPRLSTGHSRVFELGGCFVAVRNSYLMRLHDWSVLAKYVDNMAPELFIARSIKGLSGRHLEPVPSKQLSFLRHIAKRIISHTKSTVTKSTFFKRLHRAYHVARRYPPSTDQEGH